MAMTGVVMAMTGLPVPVVLPPFAGRFGELSWAKARRAGRERRC